MVFQVGDLVTRISYNHDVVFKILNIRGEVAYLKGEQVRLYADAPLEDLVLYLPTRYEDESVINLNEASDGDVVTVTGEVYSSPTVAFFGRNRSKLTCHMMINNIAVKVTFFNQPYLKKRLVMGETVTVKGKWEQKSRLLLDRK